MHTCHLCSNKIYNIFTDKTMKRKEANYKQKWAQESTVENSVEDWRWMRLEGFNLNELNHIRGVLVKPMGANLY